MSAEQLFEIAAKELEANSPRKGLYAQAFAEAMGEESKARAIYIKLRVEQLQESLSQQNTEHPRGERKAHSGSQPDTPSGIAVGEFVGNVPRVSNGVKALVGVTFALWAIVWATFGHLAEVLLGAAGLIPMGLIVYPVAWLTVGGRGKATLALGWHILGFLATICVTGALAALLFAAGFHAVWRDTSFSPFVFFALLPVIAFSVCLALKLQASAHQVPDRGGSPIGIRGYILLLAVPLFALLAINSARDNSRNERKALGDLPAETRHRAPPSSAGEAEAQTAIAEPGRKPNEPADLFIPTRPPDYGHSRVPTIDQQLREVGITTGGPVETFRIPSRAAQRPVIGPWADIAESQGFDQLSAHAKCQLKAQYLKDLETHARSRFPSEKEVREYMGGAMPYIPNYRDHTGAC
jgi:hypothetical protein